MKRRVTGLALVLTLAMLSLAGCADAGFKAQSVKSSTYQKQPKRILIDDSHLGVLFAETLFMRARTGEFNERMVHVLAACGVPADYVKPGPLTIEDPLQAKIKSFGADSVLLITVLVENLHGSGVTDASYDAKLTDAATKAVIWNASIHYEGGLVGNGADVITDLSKTLIDRMKADGVIPASCSAG